MDDLTYVMHLCGLTDKEDKEKMEKENEKKEFNDKPITECYMSMSKDGKYFIHKTTITHIKPINYLKKVMEG